MLHTRPRSRACHSSGGCAYDPHSPVCRFDELPLDSRHRVAILHVVVTSWISVHELLASYRPPTYVQIMTMGRDDSPKQLNGKGLRTRLKVLGKSTNGGVTVLRQRLCEALEVSTAPPAAAASAAAAVPTAAAPPPAAAAAAAAVMMDLAD